MITLTVLVVAGVVGTIIFQVAMLALLLMLSCEVRKGRVRYLEVGLKFFTGSITIKYGDVRNDRHGAAR